MRLSKRGERVFAISLAINAVLALVILMWGVDHVNWVGDHYCFHSSIVCYGLDK